MIYYLFNAEKKSVIKKSISNFLSLLLICVFCFSCTSNKEQLLKDICDDMGEKGFEYAAFIGATFNRSQVEPGKLDDLLISYTGKNYSQLEKLYSDSVPEKDNPLFQLKKRFEELKEDEFANLSDDETQYLWNVIDEYAEQQGEKLDKKTEKFEKELDELSTYEFGHFLFNNIVENGNNIVDEQKSRFNSDNLENGNEGMSMEANQEMYESEMKNGNESKEFKYQIESFDGYSNLRNLPKGEIIRKVLPNERFKVITDEGNWLKVVFPDGLTGFIHNSQVVHLVGYFGNLRRNVTNVNVRNIFGTDESKVISQISYPKRVKISKEHFLYSKKEVWYYLEDLNGWILSDFVELE